MKTALFHNIDSEPFTWSWDSVPETFKPGEQKFMPAYLAEHYAKHLANKILTRQGKVEACSPKNPEQVPAFYELFTKIFIIEDNTDRKESQLQTDLLNKTNPAPTSTPKVETIVDKKAPQVVTGPSDPDDEDFEGLKDPSSMTVAPK